MEVPAFGFTVYWKPITLKERGELGLGAGSIGMEHAAEIVRKKALNEKGEKLFDYDDKQTMLNTPGIDVVVLRLATAMVSTPSYEDIEKN